MKILHYLGYVTIFYEYLLRNNNVLSFNGDYANNHITKKIKVYCMCTDVSNIVIIFFVFFVLLLIFLLNF